MRGKEVPILPLWKFWDNLMSLNSRGQEQACVYARDYLLVSGLESGKQNLKVRNANNDCQVLKTNKQKLYLENEILTHMIF